jgi:selenocysteine lyase/cysteine desulfurase
VLADQRAQFEIDDEVAYLNTASLSPLLRSVRAAGEAALVQRGRPWTITADHWFSDVERLRSSIARLINGSPEGVALVPASSYGLSVAARNLHAGPGDRVLVLGQEFPSSYYTWRRFAARTGSDLVEVDRQPGQRWTDAVLAALDERTAVVVVPNVHWTNGAWVDLHAVKVRAGDVGAALVVDASQSLGAVPLDIESLRPDFVVSVGYKWQLGAVGVSYLYVDERHRSGEPLEENWALRVGADDFAALVDYQDEYQPGARRFDMGQRPSFGLVPMAIAAIDQLLAWGVPDIAEALGRVTDEIAERARALGLAPPARDERGPHILGLELPPDAMDRVAGALARNGVVVSVRGRSLRIAPHLHTSTADIDRLVDALRTAL